LEGTTDITRTIAVGPLTEEEKHAYTTVVRCNLRLQEAHFPKGCIGQNLDILARGPVWDEGLDYRCGTGHGVGHILNVHEGPHNIKWEIKESGPSAPFEEGMVVTNEPGVYREGKYGIRTENEMIVVPYMETEDGTFLQFENLTFIPIDLDGIDKQYLTEEDVKLLNAYHKLVYDTIESYVDEDLKDWLKEYTREI
jgi:Xaa-Pro aminopeptidase